MQLGLADELCLFVRVPLVSWLFLTTWQDMTDPHMEITLK